MELSLKLSFFWLFITLETNVLLTMIVICGLKVLLWEAGLSAGQVLEEMELKPTQSPTLVGAELGNNICLVVLDKFKKILSNQRRLKQPTNLLLDAPTLSLKLETLVFKNLLH